MLHTGDAHIVPVMTGMQHKSIRSFYASELVVEELGTGR